MSPQISKAAKITILWKERKVLRIVSYKFSWFGNRSCWDLTVSSFFIKGQLMVSYLYILSPRMSIYGGQKVIIYGFIRKQFLFESWNAFDGSYLNNKIIRCDVCMTSRNYIWSLMVVKTLISHFPLFNLLYWSLLLWHHRWNAKSRSQHQSSSKATATKKQWCTFWWKEIAPVLSFWLFTDNSVEQILLLETCFSDIDNDAYLV